MFRLEIKIDKLVEEEIQDMISSLEGPRASAISEVAGIAARNAAIAYHRQFDREGGWIGKRYMGTGGANGTTYGANVARGWSLDSFDQKGATITNGAEHLSFKATGGTIRPKRARALTIPIVPEARDLRASVYSQNSGNRLFTIRGKNALFERTDEAFFGERGRGRRTPGATMIRRRPIRAVYLLLKSVTMGPWPGALPPEEMLADAFGEAYLEELLEEWE